MTNHFCISATTGIALALALSGCAGSGDRYPSLAQRDAERMFGSLPSEPLPSEQVEAKPLYADLGERIASHRSDAKAAHANFIAATGSTERLIRAARGSGPDSNSWAAAQIALADLDSLRSIAAIALGDLDLLYVDSSVEFARRTEIAEAREQVLVLINEEDRELARLRGLIS